MSMYVLHQATITYRAVVEEQEQEEQELNGSLTDGFASSSGRL